MTLDAHMFLDPAIVLERKQEEAARKARACGNCVHHKSMEFRGEVWHLCEFKRYTYGKRCNLYTTGKQ